MQRRGGGDGSIQSLEDRVNHKEGAVRSGLLSKVAEGTARGVMNNNNECEINRVRLPAFVCDTLARKEVFMPFNEKWLRPLVQTSARFITHIVDGRKEVLRNGNRVLISQRADDHSIDLQWGHAAPIAPCLLPCTGTVT